MDYLKDFIETVVKAYTIVPPAKSKTGGRGSAVIVYDENGNIAEINISSSLITRFYKNGNRRDDICLKQYYLYYIDKKYDIEPTLPMLYGQYLESGLIGETADGTKMTDLPRHAKTGAKLTVQKRLDNHISLWDMRKQQYGITVIEKGEYKNVQVRDHKVWDCKAHPDIKVVVWVTLDLLTTYKDGNIDYSLCIIDIKGTTDLSNKYGDYCWADISRMDLFQAVLYSRVMNVPAFVYLVHDWTESCQFQAIPINVNPNQENPVKANEAKLRILQMEQTIENFIDDIVLYEKHGWALNPSNDNCKSCKNIYCEYFGNSFEF